MAKTIDRFIAGDLNRVMVHMPRRHGKSELTSRRAPAYAMGRNPDEEIIACSYGADLAGRMNRDVQRIMGSQQYSMLFPDTSLSRRSVGDHYARNNTIFEIPGHKGSYTCAGVGGPIVGMGYRLGFIDDFCKNREEADSPVMRDKWWEWYSSAFHPAQAPGAGIMITATRWHRDDLCGRLLEKARDDAKADQWYVLKLPAICEAAGTHPDDPRQAGEALWPARYDVDALHKIKANSLYEWSSQYQQNPSPEGGTEWPATFFGPHIWFDEWPRCPWKVRVVGLDPAKGRGNKTSDYSSFVELAVDTDLHIWIDADMSNSRPVEAAPGQPSICQTGVDIVRTRRPAGILIETNGFQELVATSLYRWLINAGILNCPIYCINNTEPKPSRIRSLGPYFAQNRFHVRNNPGGRLLVQQLRDFNTGDHDDGPDGLKIAETLADFLLNGHVEGVGRPEILRV